MTFAARRVSAMWAEWLVFTAASARHGCMRAAWMHARAVGGAADLGVSSLEA